MKKILFILTALALSASSAVFAQFDFMGVEELENQTEDSLKTSAEKTAEQNMPKDDYFSGFIEDIEAEKEAKAQAKQMLNEKPQIIKLRQSQLKEMERNKNEREKVRQKFIMLEQERMKPEERAQNILESYDNAPLGLNW